jgi:O-antigen/teichoic acid export membrane protein
VYLAGAVVLLAVDRPSVTVVMGLAAAGNLVTIAICAVWVARHQDRVVGPVDAVRSTWWSGLRFGAAGGAGELVLFGMLRVDFLLVAMFLTPAAVGVYAVATALTELLWVIPDGTAQIALPSAASADADALPAVFRLSLTLTAIAGVVLSVLATPLLRIVFGPAYVAGARAVPFLALAALAGGAWKMLAADVAARHSTRDRLTSATAGLLTMIAIDFVAIPALGITGAAAGAAIGYLVAAAIVLRAWCATTGRSGRVLVGIRSGDLDAMRHRAPVAMGPGGTT